MKSDYEVFVSRRPSRTSRVELVVVATTIAVVAGLLYWSSGGTRDAALDRSCIGNLHAIRVALRTYQDQYGTLPPAYLCDQAGSPMHSWRVLILPFLGHADLFHRYHLDEPWNSPHNLYVADEMPAEFRCQADDGPLQDNDTSYVAVVGAGTPWQGASATRVADGDERVVIVEVAQSNILWTEPRDLALATLGTWERHSTPSLPTHHDRNSRFSSLNHLILLGDSAHPADAQLLRALLTDGKAFGRLANGSVR